MYGNNIEYTFNKRVKSLKVKITVQNNTLESLEEIYFHSLSNTTFLNIQPRTNGTVPNNAADSEGEINKIAVFNTKMKIHVANYKHIGYDIIDYTQDPVVGIDGHVEIEIFLNPKKIYTSEQLVQHDMIMMFYKKLLPFYKLTAYAIQDEEIHRLGNIERVAFDKPAQKYKVVFENGLSILYEGMPFDNNSIIDITGTHQMTPPEALWLLDENFTDLKFINTSKIESTEINYLSADSSETWTEIINRLDQNELYIKEMTGEFPTLNQTLRHDYQLTMNNNNRLIKHITEQVVEFTWLPTRLMYMKMEKYLKIKLILRIHDKDDPTIMRDVTLNCKIQNNYGEIIEGVI